MEGLLDFLSSKMTSDLEQVMKRYSCF